MISIEKANPNYYTCYDCVHMQDTIEMCKLRGCIHAIRELKECYEPKETHEERI